jgi:predicted O-linked N-acetylglucosamine transferase (SPINDLY family)
MNSTSVSSVFDLRRRFLTEAFTILRQNGMTALIDHIDTLEAPEDVLPSSLTARLEMLAGFVMGYDPKSALLLCDEAIGIDPETIPAWLMRGGISDQIGNHSGSLESMLYVVNSPKASPEHKIRASDLLVRMGKDELALEIAKAAYRELGNPLNHAQTLMYIGLRTADWDLVDGLSKQMNEAYERGGFSSVNESPRTNLLWCSNEIHNIEVTENWSKSALPLPAKPFSHRRVFPTDRKIRVGYLSSDFREHPTSRLINGLLRHHDREKFELFMYCSGWDDGSSMRREIESHFDHIHSVTDLDNAEAAGLIRGHEIDVLVELNGPTRSNRMGILGYRPAPVQIDYMGWPGSVGGRVVDYVIVDNYTLPEGKEVHYPEKVIRVKEIYQINDYAEQRGVETPLREIFNLPKEAKVLGMFNAINKVRNEVWSVWMEIMRRVPDSVLWLLDPGAVARKKIGKAAARAGIDPKRIIIAPKMKQAEHLARLSLCDVMLDPWPYGGHTSTSDALFAGIPVVAMEGDNFTGRVSGGLLKAAGLDVLIATDERSYIQKVLKLLQNPSYLSELKTFIREQVPKNDVFNAKSKTKQFEYAYVQALRRACAGLPPIQLYGYSNTTRKQRDSLQTARLWRTGKIPERGFLVSSGEDIRIKNIVAKPLENDEWKLYCKIPYCIDYTKKEIVYALGVDPKGALQSPFHYQYLRSNARYYMSLPWNVRMADKGDDTPSLQDPVFIFSPGRCGSTLLSHLFRQMGIISISEPDIFINAALCPSQETDKDFQNREILRRVTDDLLSPIGASGLPIAIKLRSNANHNPAKIVEVCRSRPKSVFITRKFLPWSQSRLKAFSNDMQSNIGIYNQSLKTYEWLKNNTDCLLLRYEELSLENTELFERIGRFFGVSVDVSSLEGIFAEDSQKGTALASSNLKKEFSQEVEKEILRVWGKHVPRTLLESLDLTDLITGA